MYRSLTQEIDYPGRKTSYSHQVSAGIQRQFGNDMSVEVNYVFTGGRREETAQQVNLTYGACTTNENNANYGKPAFSDNLAYQPRMLQLGFRTTF